ncbi:hypothetical protein [Aestuariicoccus sp. MJ-SS9]|uniref:hypothetical protein n=1 Tax=Aestuariicoccus sp. MJ-SS9 TaxID=3079855 RepID=UPI002908B3A8|nr:hypothetical protein [Aestuariicoccus sp. MJ-SS9]MDU8913062.1 hypothetical protein [Aestuariicoccus sp. MJ-SS9]
MMEFLFTLAILVLVAGGLGLGLVLNKRPVRTSCGAAESAGGQCADCPLKRRATAKAQP